MKERPIIFGAPMVRAILAGTKTQTRRVVKWRDPDKGLNLGFSGLEASGYAQGWVLESPTRTSREWRCQPTPCPYGQPGTVLWVREAWAPIDSAAYDDGQSHECALYRADEALPVEFQPRWKPSIHMPRWASRITLEVTGVRVERLQQISEADAMAEGASYHDGRGVGHSGWRHDYGAVHADARSAYARLWDQINGPDSWDANPWVWVIEFKRVTP